MDRVLRLSETASEPWKNGGGVTRTLARQGDDWRVSIASIKRDGAYSSFPGLLRLSRVLRGAGLILRHGDTTVALEPDVTVTYDGAPVWHATLEDGPCEALNVMIRSDMYRAWIQPVNNIAVIPPAATALVLANNARLHIANTIQMQSDDYAVLNASDARRHVQIEACREQDSPLLILIEPLAHHADSV